MPDLRVLSVGQCGFDNGQLSRFLRATFGAQTVPVDTCEEAIATLGSQAFQLVLVNRILDADGSSGTDVIRTIKADPRFAPIATMLVSNYPDAQAQAVAIGAQTGFGKSDIGRPNAVQAIKNVFGSLISS